jgi:hypothetical protein
LETGTKINKKIILFLEINIILYGDGVGVILEN